MMIGLSFLFSVCHFVFFSFPTWSPWMLGLASQGSSTEWPATEETGEATRAGGTAIFIYSLFSFNFENLLIRGKIIVSVWSQQRHHQLANLAHLVNPRVSFSTKVSSTTPQTTQSEKVLLILPQSEIKSGEFRISWLWPKNTFQQNVKHGRFSVIPARTRSVVILGHFFDGRVGPTKFRWKRSKIKGTYTCD